MFLTPDKILQKSKELNKAINRYELIDYEIH